MDAKKLISKIEVVYDLLQKLPLDLDFYEKYHEYKLLAIEIENLTKIDKKTSTDSKDNSFESYMANSLYGYVHFKLFPLLNFIEEKKDIFFIEFPDEKLFEEIKYHFLKLGKMEGDERYGYWLAKTENNFNDFLNNLKTTKKGNDFFIKTNIMNVITEIDSLYKHRNKDKKIKKSFIERIDDNDTYGLVKQIKGLEPDKKHKFTISLRDKGGTDYIGLYDINKLTKEEMLEPILLFQGLIITNFKNGEKINDFSKTLTGIENIPQKNTSIKPFLTTEKRKGYLKFTKNGEKIFIGNTNTRKFRLLRVLMEPIDTLGKARNIDIIFEAIKLPKDKDNHILKDNYLKKNRQISIIEYTIKELQKIKKLQGRFHFVFDNGKRIMWLEVS